MSLGEQWGIGLVSTAHFRPAATGGPYSQLVLIPVKVSDFSVVLFRPDFMLASEETPHESA